MNRLEQLERFFLEVGALTLNHEEDDKAWVSPAKLGAALEKVDSEWWKKASEVQFCYRCKLPMQTGVALMNGFTGSPDFMGDQSGVLTITTDASKIKMVECWKCPKCGKSLSKA